MPPMRPGEATFPRSCGHSGTGCGRSTRPSARNGAPSASTWPGRWPTSRSGCAPIVLLADGRVTGFVDLGELGAADRWWDVAVGAWSGGWNFGVELEPLFYESYGIEPDPGRIRFFRLLYDLAS